MKKIDTDLNLNRKKVIFITASGLIAVIFLASIITVLLKKPSADIISDTSNQPSTMHKLDSSLHYNQISTGLVAIRNSLPFRLDSSVKTSMKLAGMPEDKLRALQQIQGYVSIYRDNNATSPVVTKVQWNGSLANEIVAGERVIGVLNQNMLEGFWTQGNTTYDVVVKPRCYLAVKKENVDFSAIDPQVDNDDIIKLGQFVPGDLNDDNYINAQDVAIFRPHYATEAGQSGYVAEFDFNRSGSIDAQDWAIAFGATHYDTRGADTTNMAIPLPAASPGTTSNCTTRS